MKCIECLRPFRGCLVVTALLLFTACTPDITSPATAVGQVGEPFEYRIAATHNPTAFAVSSPLPAGLSFAAATGTIAGTPAQAGSFPLVIGASNDSGETQASLTVEIKPAGGGSGNSHAVVDGKELFITASTVLNDARAQAGGAWHFRSVLKRLAGGAGADEEAFAQAWFETWATNTALPGVNDPDLKQRTAVRDVLRNAWAGDRIKLIAIVNRMDLTRFNEGDITQPPSKMGEGRFIYEVRQPNGSPMLFTLILEFGLPAPSGDLPAEIERWGKKWHALGRPELGGPTEFTPAYLAELQAITDEYSATGNLNQLRTNELVGSPWELREFKVQGSPLRLVQVPVAVTPAFRLLGQPADLVSFINANTAAIEARGVTEVPPALQAAVAPIPGARPPSFTWSNVPATSPRAAFIVSFNACNGCHAKDTGTPFQHIGASVNDPSRLSDFLRKKITLTQTLPGKLDQQHDEMADRRELLAKFARDVPPGQPLKFTPAELNSILRSRANRTH